METDRLGTVPFVTVDLPLRIAIHSRGCFVDAITVPVKPHRYLARLKHRIHRVYLFRKPLFALEKLWTLYLMPTVLYLFFVTFGSEALRCVP